jgi:transcriptional regulator with XRE-family HTH domain
MGQPKQPDSTAKKLYDDSVCKKIRIALAASNMTVKQLSQLSGIPYSTLSNVLRGKHAISMFHAARICSVMRIEPGFLMGVKKVDA